MWLQLFSETRLLFYYYRSSSTLAAVASSDHSPYIPRSARGVVRSTLMRLVDSSPPIEQRTSRLEYSNTFTQPLSPSPQGRLQANHWKAKLDDSMKATEEGFDIPAQRRRGQVLVGRNGSRSNRERPEGRSGATQRRSRGEATRTCGRHTGVMMVTATTSPS